PGTLLPGRYAVKQMRRKSLRTRRERGGLLVGARKATVARWSFPRRLVARSVTVILDLDENRRHVVLAAVLVGTGDQLAARISDVGVRDDDLLDLVVLHHAGEPVRAEDINVAGRRLVVLQIDHDLILHSKSARDDVLRQLAPLLLREVG